MPCEGRDRRKAQFPVGWQGSRAPSQGLVAGKQAPEAGNPRTTNWEPAAEPVTTRTETSGWKDRGPSSALELLASSLDSSIDVSSYQSHLSKEDENPLLDLTRPRHKEPEPHSLPEPAPALWWERRALGLHPKALGSAPAPLTTRSPVFPSLPLLPQGARIICPPPDL